MISGRYYRTAVDTKPLYLFNISIDDYIAEKRFDLIYKTLSKFMVNFQIFSLMDKNNYSCQATEDFLNMLGKNSKTAVWEKGKDWWGI